MSSAITKRNKLTKRPDKVAQRRMIGVGELAYTLIDLKYWDKQIITICKAMFPDSHIDQQHIDWYRANPHKYLT